MKLNRLRSFGLNADVHTFVLQLDLANLNALKLLMPKKELSFLFDPLKYFHDQCTCFKQVFMTFDPPPKKTSLEIEDILLSVYLHNKGIPQMHIFTGKYFI